MQLSFWQVLVGPRACQTIGGDLDGGFGRRKAVLLEGGDERGGAAVTAAGAAAVGSGQLVRWSL